MHGFCTSSGSKDFAPMLISSGRTRAAFLLRGIAQFCWLRSVRCNGNARRLQEGNDVGCETALLGEALSAVPDRTR
ncbi:hypothetical protein ACSS6W_000157 [Trichoderma asperelloides]